MNLFKVINIALLIGTLVAMVYYFTRLLQNNTNDSLSVLPQSTDFIIFLASTIVYVMAVAFYKQGYFQAIAFTWSVLAVTAISNYPLAGSPGVSLSVRILMGVPILLFNMDLGKKIFF